MPRGLVIARKRDWATVPIDMTCMNPTAVCAACIFHDGRLAKYCPPAERSAKAALDANADAKEAA